jgi:hypothetical protein
MTVVLPDHALNQLRIRLKQRRGLRDHRYRGRIHASVNGLAGLACACSPPPRTTLRGYRIVRTRDAVSAGLSGIGAADQLALIPISDKKAVANAIRLFASRRVGIAGMGASEQASGAVSGATAGAKAGSVIPGIGTVIGAFVGAVVGWLSAKPKPVRATKEQIAQCQTMASEYMGYAAQSPTVPLPMELTQIKDLTWCGAAIHGAMVKLKDPRFFTSGFDERIAIARQIVRKVYETKVGDTVEISGLSFRDAKGRKIDLPGTSFVNKPFTSILELTERVLMPLEVANCAPWGKGACQSYIDLPLIKRTLFDLLGYAARTELPNISESDLHAASQVAAQTGTASSDVVKAVEQIINRPVVRGETAALLTGQTDVPGVTAPVPGVPVPPSTAPPLPGVTSQSATDVTALISQLLAQGQQSAQVAQSAIDALAARGTAVTPAVTAAVQKEVVAQAGVSSTALLTVGGILAALFLLSRPAKRGRR